LCCGFGRQTGLTLLELVVSLLVMTILTSVAITSVSGIQEQARYEKTVRLAEEFRKAIVDIDTKSIRGYVADMGNIPSDFVLRELLENYKSRPAYGNIAPSFAGTTCPVSVSMYGGWDGPYLYESGNPSDPDTLRDAWGGKDGTGAGEAFENTTNYGWVVVPPSSTSQRTEIKTLGCDRKTGASAAECQNQYAQDMTFALATTMWRTKKINSVTVHLAVVTSTTKKVLACIFYRDAADVDGDNRKVEFLYSASITLSGIKSTQKPIPFPISNTTTIPAGQNQIVVFDVTSNQPYQNKNPIKIDLLPGSHFPVVFW